MRNIDIPIGLKGFEAYKWLQANQRIFVKAKKSAMKKADGVCLSTSFVNRKGVIVKEALPTEKNDNELKNSTIINTCLYYDSHGDVHLPGIWKKSLADNNKRPVNDILLLQEHKMAFNSIIADGADVFPYTKTLTWRELGVDFDGETESLIFDNTISKDRNPYMFGQYAKGYVKNHSVGMYYVNIDLAIGYEHKDFKEENELFYKWIDLIPNKAEVIEDGMFWAVSEAKVGEGSAVPRGSNPITPVYSKGVEPLLGTPDEPDQSTQAAKESIFQTINQIFK